MKTFVGLLALVGLVAAMPLPQAGTTPPNAVPFEQIQRVALNRGLSEYQGARLGTIVPYVDENGNATAYMFHFQTEGKSFPDYDQVADDILVERERLNPNTDLTRWTSKYSHVLVSARGDKTPCYNFGYGASEYYAIGRKGLERARQVLGSDAQLTRIYFVCPVTYMEYGNQQGEHVVYASHFERTWNSREAFCNYVIQTKADNRVQFPVDEAATAAYHAEEWERELVGNYGNYSEVLLPTANLAPFYDWSYGCTPTSAAMVIGWLDRAHNFGRLIDYFYQRRDGVEGENDFQVPNGQLECALAMGTDTLSGGTGLYAVSPGLEQVGNDNGYAWIVHSVFGAEWNDWAWDTVMAEIDMGHDMVWSALWAIHSLAGYGYRTDDKYVYVHNTWWVPAEWWSHSGDDWSHVAAPYVDPGDPHKIRLLSPRGDTTYNGNGRGEMFFVGDTIPISWDNSGNPGTRVAIDYSTDGGRNWTPVIDNTPDNGSYRWGLGTSIYRCDSVRIRLLQYNGADYTAGDGSFGNFRMLREPLPPQQTAPPNGLPVFNPPVVLTVDSATSRADSIDFKLVHGVDTILRQTGTTPRCTVPTSMLDSNQTYKWKTRAHNQYGWGDWGVLWTFRVMFDAIAESPQPPAVTPSAGPGLHRLSDGAVELLAPAPGTQRIVVFDALGNAVRVIPAAWQARAVWDLRDAFGRMVGAGLYFVRSEGAGRAQVRKLVLVD